MKDLTKGRPSVLILTFALPIFLANLLQLTYSLADTRIVGTFLGDNALAAVGATTTLSTTCDFSIFFAVRRSHMNMVFIARLLSA